MRRMLDPTKVGGIPSTIEFDKDGNRKVKKNLGVDGKLTLKSLVSASNPDGDITKELGGGGGNFKQLYVHAIRIYLSGTIIWVQLTLDNNEPIDNLEKLINALKIYLNGTSGESVACSGNTNDGEAIVALYYNNDYIISYITLKYDSSKENIVINNTNLYDEYKITDTITIPRQTI